MSQTIVDVDWREKYKSLKRKYKQIRELRTTAVKADTADIMRKIDEHKRNHEILRDSILQENDEITRILSKTKEAKAEIRRLQERVNELRISLGRTDTILSAALKYPSVTVECIGAGNYRITVAYRQSIVFELMKDSEVHYLPVRIPPSSRLPEYLNSPFKMSPFDLHEFFRSVDRAVENLSS